MNELFTQKDIQATEQKVWDRLMDFGRYPDWNPFIREIKGEPRVGQTLEVLLQPQGTSPQKIKPKVLKVEPLKEFRWRGSLPIPGFFVGEHYFKIEPLATGNIRFTHGESFSGLLVPLLGSFLRKKVLPSFEAMNEALQKGVEAPKN